MTAGCTFSAFAVFSRFLSGRFRVGRGGRASLEPNSICCWRASCEEHIPISKFSIWYRCNFSIHPATWSSFCELVFYALHEMSPSTVHLAVRMVRFQVLKIFVCEGFLVSLYHQSTAVSFFFLWSKTIRTFTFLSSCLFCVCPVLFAPGLVRMYPVKSYVDSPLIFGQSGKYMHEKHITNKSLLVLVILVRLTCAYHFAGITVGQCHF